MQDSVQNWPAGSHKSIRSLCGGKKQKKKRLLKKCGYRKKKALERIRVRSKQAIKNKNKKRTKPNQNKTNKRVFLPTNFITYQLHRVFLYWLLSNFVVIMGLENYRM